MTTLISDQSFQEQQRIQEMQTEISCSNQSTMDEASFSGVFVSVAETILVCY